jgi:hypothetical protein
MDAHGQESEGAGVHGLAIRVVGVIGGNSCRFLILSGIVP